MKRRRKEREVNVPVASIGDIAFLLIIFFMICSNMASESSVPLEPPASRHLLDLNRGPLVVSLNAKGEIYLDDDKLEPPDPEAVEYWVAGRLKGNSNLQARVVTFRCDKEVSKETFEPVMEAISTGGGIIAAVGAGADNNREK
ncbi:MAG: biopolymer transporter ExbD [Lentisphaerae bacterium]|nr:biopolymer transporter ExbD [Lentisphaerota bacterium]